MSRTRPCRCEKGTGSSGVDTSFTDIVKVGPNDDKETRTIPWKIPSPWQRRVFLSSALKLKSFGQAVFVNRELSKVEAELQNKVLMPGRELLIQGVERKNVRVHDASSSFEPRTNGPR